MSMLAAARAYVAAGLSVIPLECGSKHPDHNLLALTTGQSENYWAPEDHRAAWRVYTTRQPTDAELVTWFAGSDAGVGIVGGAVSGGLVRLDLEHSFCLPTWWRLLRDDAQAAATVVQLPIVATPKGAHVYFRMADPPGHDLLCSAGSGNELLVLSETQGEGCYCVAPPSHLKVYDESLRDLIRLPYVVTNGSLTAIPTLDSHLAGRLLEAARFPGLWSFRLRDMTGSEARLHRGGITLERTVGGYHESWHLSWEVLHDLRVYLDRYSALLQAVETAPPPPPSYIDETYDDS